MQQTVYSDAALGKAVGGQTNVRELPYLRPTKALGTVRCRARFSMQHVIAQFHQNEKSVGDLCKLFSRR